MAPTPRRPSPQVQTALALSDEDQATIAALKKEIEKAWKMVDASHEKVRRKRAQQAAAATAAAAGHVRLSQVPTAGRPGPTHMRCHGKRAAGAGSQEAKAKETITALKSEVASLQRLAEEGGSGAAQACQVPGLRTAAATAAARAEQRRGQRRCRAPGGLHKQALGTRAVQVWAQQRRRPCRSSPSRRMNSSASATHTCARHGMGGTHQQASSGMRGCQAADVMKLAWSPWDAAGEMLGTCWGHAGGSWGGNRPRATRAVQVDAIMALRAELAEVNEKLRASEANKAGLEADITSLQTQVMGCRATAWLAGRGGLVCS